jgi:DNA binding domain, excisionase family
MEQGSQTPSPNDATSSTAEPLLTVAAAATMLGIKDWHLRRAIKRGAIPFYTPFNGRKRVRLSDVLAFIEASRQGGGE